MWVMLFVLIVLITTLIFMASDIKNTTRIMQVIKNVRRWNYYILVFSLRYDLDPCWIEAIIAVESGGDPFAVNLNDPSYGLMQLTPIAVQDIGEDPENPVWKEDPAINIEYGCRYLRKLFDDYGAKNYEEAIQWYNAGPRHDSPDYLKRVKRYYEIFKNS